MFCLESFQMIANGVSKFLSFSLRRVYFIHFKKSRFVEDVLFHPKKVMAFTKIEDEIETAMFMFTLSQTR